jgi:hypothetical protein
MLVRIDLYCARDADLTSWLRVSVRRTRNPLAGRPRVTRIPVEEDALAERRLRPGTRPRDVDRDVSPDDVPRVGPTIDMF